VADAAISTLIDAVYPGDEATGIPLLAPIWIVFSTEMDEDSIENNFFIYGPNTDTISGPGALLWDRAPSFVQDKEDYFTSTEKGGLVGGEITFERVSLGDISVPYAGYDYSGAGNLYRTKVIFTPTRPFVATTLYSPYLVGQDSGGNNGIRKRSVFDPQRVAGAGTADINIVGSYTGSMSSETFYVEIAAAGDVGTATYRWWVASSPLVVHGPNKTRIAEWNMADGVKVSFESTGTYSAGDKFSCVVGMPDEATGQTDWEFTSGSGSIQSIPTAASTSVIGLPSSVVASGEVAFMVDETSPANRDFNLDLAAINPITILFTKTLDASTVTLDRIRVEAQEIMDDPAISVPERAGDLPKRISVSDKTLTILV